MSPKFLAVQVIRDPFVGTVYAKFHIICDNFIYTVECIARIRVRVRVHWTLTINRSVVRMPEEEAVTYHYRVLRRPRVVAFSHANLRSLAAPQRGEASAGDGAGKKRKRRTKVITRAN